MAFKGKFISNKKTGQQIRFLQTAQDTAGALLEMESIFRPRSIEPVPHYHPVQHETFEVLEGELSVRFGEGVRILKTGEQLHIPPKQVHSMWNHSPNPARVNWKVYPALDTEYFLENATGISNEMKTNAQGMPGLLQVAMMANKYSHVFRVAKPPYAIQKLVFGVLAPMGYLAGYRSAYKRFVD